LDFRLVTHLQLITADRITGGLAAHPDL